MRLRAKTDGNHQEIMNAFRQCGCSVFSTHQVGKGFVDIIIGFQGLNFMVEIKDGSLAPSARKLTPDEKDFHKSWNGRVDIVEYTHQVPELVNQWRRVAKVHQQFYKNQNTAWQ